MKYLLDTNICIYIIKNKPEKVKKRLMQIPEGDIALSSITVAELYYGVEKSSKHEQNMIALLQFLMPFKIYDFTSKEALIYGKLRTELERKGKLIGAMDLLIGSIAVSNELILVTNNEKEFKRIKSLRIENWAK